MIKELQVNKRVDILVENGPYEGSYISKVAEVNGDIFKVMAPFTKGEIVPLRRGQEVQIFCTGNSAAFTFSAEVRDRQSKPLALLTLERTGDIKRIQRREYFRVDAKVKVKYQELIEEEQNEEDQENPQTSSEMKETMTIDISGGGLKLVADDDTPRSGLLEVYIDIPGLKKAPISSKIVNNYNLPDGHAIGIEFIDITQSQQDTIIGWLFDYQRELRQKGLL